MIQARHDCHIIACVKLVACTWLTWSLDCGMPLLAAKTSSTNGHRRPFAYLFTFSPLSCYYVIQKSLTTTQIAYNPTIIICFNAVHITFPAARRKRRGGKLKIFPLQTRNFSDSLSLHMRMFDYRWILYVFARNLILLHMLIVRIMFSFLLYCARN